jgi:thymidylate kinase
MRGKFIFLEGCDKSGKSTQAKLLHHYLSKKEKTLALRYPSNLCFYKKIERALLAT